MIAIVTPAEMAAIDAAASEPLHVLIERAGSQVARRARSMLGGVYGRRVAVLAGPGNNGADGRVAARLLESWGVRVSVVEPTAAAVPRCDLVIDAAFGTGMNRPYVAPALPADAKVLAVDIPSGVDGLTGVPNGRPNRADHTITFAALKPGLLLGDGPEFSGMVEVSDIGLDTSSASRWLFARDDAQASYPRRSSTDHKWKHAVWVIGGSNGMIGAPVLAAQAAQRAGSGMVRCSLPGVDAPILANEVVFHSLPSDNWHEQVLAEQERFGALVVGPGIGRSESARHALRQLVAASDKPLVIDADALHLLGKSVSDLRSSIVLTPHDGEFEALAGHRPEPDRFASVAELAAGTGATVLLKGPATIVAGPDGRCLAVNHGDERLATAGTGDVLAGAIGAYLAAGMAPDEAAALGAWMHAEAGHTQSRFGMVATDLIDGLAQATRELNEPTQDGVVNASN